MGSRPAADVYDVLIVGAGPAGITASLRAIEKNLKYVTVEQDEVGGTVAKYPRQKLVMTSPVEFPMYGKFKKTELSKENLLTFWDKVLHRADFQVRAGEKVDAIKKGSDGIFTVTTSKSQYRTRAVILALGKTGTPRKLGVKGEEMPKVMYRLIEADHYINKKILVVGGGDSAVEAAMGLAHQAGNEVTLSYRQDRFSRIKERNSTRVDEEPRFGFRAIGEPVLLVADHQEAPRDALDCEFRVGPLHSVCLLACEVESVLGPVHACQGVDDVERRAGVFFEVGAGIS